MVCGFSNDLLSYIKNPVVVVVVVVKIVAVSLYWFVSKNRITE